VVPYYMLFGVLMPRSVIKGKSTDSLIKSAKSKGFSTDIVVEMDGGEAGGIGGVGGEHSGSLKFSEETLLEVERMEREQGYNFDTTAVKKILGLEYFTPYQLYILEKWDQFDDHCLTAVRR